jgi:hypothetical protein
MREEDNVLGRYRAIHFYLLNTPAPNLVLVGLVAFASEPSCLPLLASHLA